MDQESKKILDGILAKEVSALDENEKGFLRARRSYLSNADKERYADVLKVEETEEPENEKVDYSKMTKAELEKVCAKRKLEVPEDAKKADLVELLKKEDQEK